MTGIQTSLRNENFFYQFNAPLIFAHRGASAYAPENTLAAFELAVRQGTDGIELDAKLSADGQVVVIHDQTVDRTTSHSGTVRQFDLATLRTMDAGSHFDVAFRGEPIPSLDEVLESVGQQIFINIELTNYASLTDDLPERAAQLVKRHNLGQRVLFSSFNPMALRRVRRQLPDTPISMLALAGGKGALARGLMARLLRCQGLHPDQVDVNARLIEQAKQRSMKVMAYTVNREEDMRRLFQLGVDGIFTDDPPLALQILQRLASEENKLAA
jgi:glycerophosphoryl diester phosphodiesterase